MLNQIDLKVTSPPPIHLVLIIGGLVILLGWIFLAASLNLATKLPCDFSPAACSEGRQVADVIIFTPILIGSALLAFGTTSLMKFHWVIKTLIGLVLVWPLSQLGWYLMIIAHIAIHGL